MKILTAGQKAVKASSDTTDYDLREVAYAETEDVGIELRKCIENYRNLILEPEFCVVMIRASDPLITNLTRKKFYCWPFLPKPRPNQSVFLYNKGLDKITKRLWVLPNEEAMAVLSEMNIVPKEYETMQRWSKAFFKGIFWDFIRQESDIQMLSEHEFIKSKVGEYSKDYVDTADKDFQEYFDLSKISFGKFKSMNSGQKHDSQI